MTDDGETPSEADAREPASERGVEEREEPAADAAPGSESGLAERVDEAEGVDPELADDVEALVAEVETFRAEAAELTAERDDLVERLQRTQADFQNYKKRAERAKEQAEHRATASAVERFLDVRDNLQRALDAEGDIREGVEATLREFDRVLEAEGVEAIDPAPGAEVDPTRHEVMMRVPDDRPEDTVSEVYRPGYEIGGTVVREAQVTVSEGARDGEGSAEE